MTFTHATWILTTAPLVGLIALNIMLYLISESKRRGK